MHILLFHDSILPAPNYGGIERIVVTLAEEYSRLGHKVSVLCKKGSKLPRPLHVIEVPENWDGQDVEFILKSQKNLNPHGDVEFIHSHQPLVKEPARPYLVTIHGNGRPAEHYHANTNFLSRSHAHNHNSEICVFNGIDTKRYTYCAEKEDYYIFLAKTTWRVKNLKTALNWARDLNVKLKIIGGDGKSRGNIEYLGFVDDKIKNHVLGHAKALIYPTNWDEPCAGAPLEALSCGTPIISTANGCMPEMVSDDTGVICRNYQELLQAPQKLVRVSTLKCRQRAETDFSVERMAEDYLALMGKIIQIGKLVDDKHRPRYNFKKTSVDLMFKPSFKNKLQVMITGKI